MEKTCLLPFTIYPSPFTIFRECASRVNVVKRALWVGWIKKLEVLARPFRAGQWLRERFGQGATVESA
jgi:hypothetical protein